MNWIDVVLLLILALGIGYGVWTGMMWQVANVAGFIAGLLAAGRFSDPVGAWVQRWGRWFAERPSFSDGMGYGMVFFGVLAAVQFGTFLLRCLLRKVDYGRADHIGGGVLGFVTGLLACAAITTILLPAAGQRGTEAARNSALAPLIMRGMEKTQVFLSEAKAERAKRFLRSLRDE